MGIRLVVAMEALPGKRDEMIAQSVERAKEVRQEAGCVQFAYFQDVENPDSLMLLEKWADIDALEAHWARLRARPTQPAPLRTMLEMERYEYDAEGG